MTNQEADNVRNSRLAIEAMHKQSCESYKFCKSCKDIVMAFQIGLLFGKADKAIEEVKKPLTPQPCDDAVSRQAVISTIYDNKSDFKNDFAQGFFADKIRALLPFTLQPKVGRWIYDKNIDNWRCSECGEIPKTPGYCGSANFMVEHFKYCNHCGTEMGEVEE